jgi:hypothetical protein
MTLGGPLSVNVIKEARPYRAFFVALARAPELSVGSAGRSDRCHVIGDDRRS